MSKELTEQWLKGNLADEGVYYWRISDGQELIKSQLAMFAYRLCSDAEKVECLAPVPSYEEYKKMKEQLIDANRVIQSFIRVNPFEEYGPAEAYCERWQVK